MGGRTVPLSNPGVPIGALFLSEGKDPVGIVAYDIARGIAVFSVNRARTPVPRECFTEDLRQGDLLTSLPSVADEPTRSSRVLAVEETYASEAVGRETVAVKHAAQIDLGKWQCGSPMLKDGKIAAIFLNNGTPPNSEKSFGYAMPARHATPSLCPTEWRTSGAERTSENRGTRFHHRATRDDLRWPCDHIGRNS